MLAIATGSTVTYAVEPANPAHALAEKFSRASDSERKPAHIDETPQPTSSPRPQTANDTVQIRARVERERRAAEEQRAYEEDMLARARAEAEARLKADMAREQDAARQRAQAEQAGRSAEEAHQRSEAERLAREREAEARKLAERLRAARRAREEARARAAAETEAKAQAAARQDNARKALQRRTERLAGKLEDIRTRRAQHAQTTATPYKTGGTPSATETGDRLTAASDEPREVQKTHAQSATTDDAYRHRATVLLVMKPGNRGIRRWNKTADPMLCIETSCYISNSAETAARRISRRKGFGPGIALGTRAGACNDQLACVFREVDLVNDHAWMQPVDLRIVRHDRREARRVTADPTCAVSAGRIACARAIESDDYRAWIVPEHVAQQAGAAALRAALDMSLPGNLLAGAPMR